jgi:hypothetical protein
VGSLWVWPFVWNVTWKESVDSVKVNLLVTLSHSHTHAPTRHPPQPAVTPRLPRATCC